MRFSLTEATTRHCGREPVVGVLKYCNTTHRSFLIIDIHINIIKYCNTTHRSFLIIDIHISIIKYFNDSSPPFLNLELFVSLSFSLKILPFATTLNVGRVSWISSSNCCFQFESFPSFEITFIGFPTRNLFCIMPLSSKFPIGGNVNLEIRSCKFCHGRSEKYLTFKSNWQICQVKPLILRLL